VEDSREAVSFADPSQVLAFRVSPSLHYPNVGVDISLLEYLFCLRCFVTVTRTVTLSFHISLHLLISYHPLFIYSSPFPSQSQVEFVASLLRVDAAQLGRALTHRHIVSGGDEMDVNNNEVQALVVRDALSKVCIS
jgi:hypothetical protein